MSLSDQFTAKQREVLHDYLTGDFKMMILTGAIRSGKTFIDNLLFLYELKRTALQATKTGNLHPQYILAGASSGSIQNNVINSLDKQFGLRLNPDRHNHFHLFGVDIVPVYTESIRGLAGARGFDSSGAYINEASLANQEVFQEILNRCSDPGARIICDSNPDSPQHWLKTDYIDNDNPKLKTVSYRFTLDDNTFLDPGYAQQIKAATPSGMLYDRAIKGLWVTGEGVVYKGFDERTMTIDRKDLPDGLAYTAGVDWGFEHPTAIEIIGHDDKGNYYLVDEAYGQLEQVDPYWISVAQRFRKKYGMNMPYYCDTARNEHIQNFKQHHINAKFGYKNVLDGVERVASLIKQHRFFVVKGAAPNFINEIYQYVWDENTGAPKKEHDHAQDAVRYCIATPLWLAEQNKRRNTDRTRSTNYLNDLGLI
ncbi:MAG: PBSX family phage terminase large subunit [Limosilactobacillus sp.]